MVWFFSTKKFGEVKISGKKCGTTWQCTSRASVTHIPIDPNAPQTMTVTTTPFWRNIGQTLLPQPNTPLPKTPDIPHATPKPQFPPPGNCGFRPPVPGYVSGAVNQIKTFANEGLDECRGRCCDDSDCKAVYVKTGADGKPQCVLVKKPKALAGKADWKDDSTAHTQSVSV